MRQNWYEIKNSADKADIYIYGEVGGHEINAKTFIDELTNYKNQELTIHINSTGGSVFDGLAIYNALKNHSKKVTTKVDGIAASIASVIAMAGDKIEMAENSLFMIHNPFAMSGGDAKELRKTATILDKIRNEIANIYASKSKHTSDHYISLMDVESWFNSTETLELGLINEISKPIKIENNYNFSNFINMNSEKLQTIINKNSDKMEDKNLNAEEIINETPEVKNEAENKEKSVLEKIKSLVGINPNNEHEEGHKEEADVADWQGMETRIENLEKAVHKLEEAMGMKDVEIENAKKEIEEKENIIENKSNEISKLKAGKTDVAPVADPEIIENKVLDPNAAFFNAMVQTLKRKA